MEFYGKKCLGACPWRLPPAAEGGVFTALLRVGLVRMRAQRILLSHYQFLARV
jgi:hypothetical protein